MPFFCSLVAWPGLESSEGSRATLLILFLS